MKMLLFLLIVIVPCGARETTRKTLDQATEIDGYPCDKGYAFFYADGRLSQCTVSREISLGDSRIPAGSLIRLSSDGSPLHVMLVRDSAFGEVRCKGGGLLGPGEGASTAVYPSGKLKECFLAGDQQVQGIPCKGGSAMTDLFGGGSGAFFYESGKLKSCTLSQDFGKNRRGERITQPE